MQQVGMSTCSLGEVRNRGDLVIFWGADPVETHPRHLERYSADPRGLFVPRGRQDRHVVVIDSKPSATSALADTFIQLPRGSDLSLITALQTLVSGETLPQELERSLDRKAVLDLGARLTGCRYGAIFYGPEFAAGSDIASAVEALFRLVTELNAKARFTVRGLGSPGALPGAETVMCWLTGFPFAVNFADGYPRYSPAEFSANTLLERGAVDACVVVGSECESKLSPRAQQALERLPTISLDAPNVEPRIGASVQFTTAIYGIHAAGTAYRMDDVPIPLRSYLPSELPTDDRVLREIASRLRRASRGDSVPSTVAST